MGNDERLYSIPREQLNLPAGFTGDGKRMLSLKELLRTPDALTVPALTPAQAAELSAERIRRKPKFDVVMVGIGRVDRDTAVAEVRAQTALGRNLTEIELRTIRLLYEKIAA